MFPLAINHRMYLRDTTNRRSYFFLGLGVAFINVGDNGTRIMSAAASAPSLSERIIAEAALTLSDATDRGVRANSIGLYIGYRVQDTGRSGVRCAGRWRRLRNALTPQRLLTPWLTPIA